MKDKELTPQAIASRAINLSPTEENLLKVAAEISVYAMRKFIAWKKEYLKKHSDNAYN